MTPRLLISMVAALAVIATSAYAIAWFGAPVLPWAAVAIGLLAGLALAWPGSPVSAGSEGGATAVWVCVVAACLVALLRPAWPALLPPGGASDLTHHLLLVDVIERAGHLVDGAGREGELGEMAHYTPGLHLLVVIAGAIAGVDAYRVAYPLLALTIALKAGFVFLIAVDLLAGMRARTPLALASVGLVLFAPRAYSLDGFLQAGFYSQVASELFVVAGWWGLSRWWVSLAPGWMVFVGLMAAAVFLVWPIWIGPLMLAAGVALLCAPRATWRVRLQQGAMAVGPLLVVAAMHLSSHAAWLRMAGTSGAVPALVPGPLGWALMGLALVGAGAGWRRHEARVTLWLTAGIALQAVVLFALARARGAETPYMAMKMIYLAVYPVAVLGALGLAALISRGPSAGAWAAAGVVLGLGLRAAAAVPVPEPFVDVDLDAAGRWARSNLPAACVDYIARDAEQAYWLHLAVMGQPRASARTADIDGYTANRAVGRWIEGSALPYAIARRDLLPGEVLRDAEVVHAVGTAVVIRRPGVACPVPMAQ